MSDNLATETSAAIAVIENASASAAAEIIAEKAEAAIHKAENAAETVARAADLAVLDERLRADRRIQEFEDKQQWLEMQVKETQQTLSDLITQVSTLAETTLSRLTQLEALAVVTEAITTPPTPSTPQPLPDQPPMTSPSDTTKTEALPKSADASRGNRRRLFRL